MRLPLTTATATATATAAALSVTFWSDALSNDGISDIMRWRTVSNTVLVGTLDIPSPPKHVLADWHREVTVHHALTPGDVEEIPLARTRMRWPDYARSIQAMSQFTDISGIPGILAHSDVSLMACVGARYHHDSDQYGGLAFCNLFLSEDSGWDVHFPAIDLRIPLTRGTAMVFDTGQPHAVIPRGNDRFDLSDFPTGQDNSQVFLSWTIPIEDPALAKAFNIRFDLSPASAHIRPIAIGAETPQLLRNGMPAHVCGETGKWLD